MNREQRRAAAKQAKKSENIELEQSFCPIKMSTGLPCPGCGITKSIVFMYDGNFTKSFYYHLFGPFAFAFLVGIIILFSIEIFTKKSFSKSIFFNLKIAYFLAITLSIYHITRLIYFLSENNFSQILKESIWY